MGHSAVRLQDPPAPSQERRRLLRHKLHTPIYATFNAPQGGLVVDLSELLDLSEDGFAVQTGEVLEVNRPLSLTLDLTETKSYIHGNGQVIWNDGTGRGGIQFSGLNDDSRRILKEWLFANLLVACSNHTARSEQLASQAVEAPGPVEVIVQPPPAPAPEVAAQFAALDAVCQHLRSSTDDPGVLFQFVAENALHLTGATGAALAYLTGDEMVCWARAGEPAPPLGSPVDTKKGLSGECVCSGLVISCADTESDTRVDREICRALRIGSILAVPIITEGRVVGLLEVFSPSSHAFTSTHETVLETLVDAIPRTHPGLSMYQNLSRSELLSAAVEPEPSAPTVPESPIEPQIPQGPGIGLRQSESHTSKTAFKLPGKRLQFGLMAAALAIAATALGYLLAPVIEKRWFGTVEQNTTQAASPVASPSAPPKTVAGRGINPDSLEELQKLAEIGDPDSQWQLGVRYHTGSGVPKDDQKAVQWFLRAAEQGHVTAQASLGAYYWAGRGVPQDLSRAYFWSTLAWAQGNEDSKSRLEALASQMTRAQVSAARQQAEEWLRRHNQRARAVSN